MDTLIYYAKAELLATLYASISRMNDHILNNNPDGVVSEQHLQINLRSNFEQLQEAEGIPTEI